MITLNDFCSLVDKHFHYLVANFGFIKMPTQEIPTMHYCPYQKGELLVRLEYSKKNDYIDVFVYNNISKIKPGEQRQDNSVSLTTLMFGSKPGYNFEKDYKSIMPSQIPIENSIRILAEFFLEYATDILSGKKWISWSDITQYVRQPIEITVHFKKKIRGENPENDDA